ncbi:regucalcin [Bombyx mori]|uniref:Regucalcin n=1 Tax=Bombyx mori TaxID=7091 RepID=A0A8R2APY2_BOMMO|nr:regucalcin [Bombyx mori]XP_004930720.1 regucalcin [Bombyx mori]XP_004930721.1 regucalcin [Bombyx mori]XP_004930722.1 regucalcin [Bombyx mori]XP_004930724.1 regucalcin [Bombyx mori]
MSVRIEKITEPLTLGEGPHWDERQQALYFVSIQDKTIHKYVPTTEKHTKTSLDGRVGFILPVEGTTDQFVVGVERKFLFIQWDGEDGSKVAVLKELGEVDKDRPNNRINDGKADPRGRLFAGTMGHEDPPGNFERNKASLYKLDSAKDGKLEKIIETVSLSNGLAWDLKEKAFYYTDSMQFSITKFDYDVDTGEISNPRNIFDFKQRGLQGIPDGTTIDTDGNLWVAVFGGSCVLKINPKNGEILQKLAIPAEQVTSATFGGPNLDILFVTSACCNVGKEQLPPSGATFMVTGLGVKGLPNVSVRL